MKKKLLIIGASGHGKVVADIAKKMDRWNGIYFLDDEEEIKSSLGIDIIGRSSDFFKYLSAYDIFIAIGDNEIREKIQNKVESVNASIPTLIHPNSIIGEEVIVEAGSVVMAGAVINCCTKVGKGCIINTGATVDHDNLIEDYVHISPGVHLAGSVTVGCRTWIGIGSVVKNNINITSGSKIGAGAVVVKDISETGTYIGVPAKKLNK